MQNNKGAQKTSSLQGWSKLTEKYFGQKLRIEERKDREAIYGLLKEYGLPYEGFHAYKSGDGITPEDFEKTVISLGFPYWISATPKLGIEDLGRLSKLGLESEDAGWEFLMSIPRLKDYKIIVMQYPDNIEFKGTVVVSRSLNGIADFVQGDRHLQLIAGETMADPLLFNENQILRYSTNIDKKHQDELYRLAKNHAGYYEFQCGVTPDKPKSIIFFDYNDELAYEDIDSLFADLVSYYTEPEATGFDVKGIPASLGSAKGKCRILLSTDLNEMSTVQPGEILISDTTNPDMTPIMKRVAAIVTDLGGVTSHAAIVTRELQIPCIVGTRDGTKKLRNGMIVTVDAFKGTVKILD